MKYHLILFLLMNIIPSLLFAKQPALTHQSISERNIKIVTEFYSAAFNQLSYPKAAQYMGEKYIQHSSHVQDGKNGFKSFINMLRARYPHVHADIKKTFSDKNYVILYVHFVLVPHTNGYATVDIFRLDKDKIVEHWGVSELIPNKLANSNGIF